ncbi:MAG: ROK family transcriptional regulator [Haliangiales bacterium]
MRERNRSLLLQLIWRAGRISRSELARTTGLSPSSVSLIVNALEQAGLVRMLGTGASRGGRRPVLLGFFDEAYCIVGVDIGASHVGVALCNLRGKVRAYEVRDHPVRDDPAGTLALLDELLESVLAERWPVADGDDDATEVPARARVMGIGVAVPSPVDPRLPGQMSPFVVPAWKGIDLVSALRARYDVPVAVENDANLGALAESWWGVGAGGEDLTYIKIATGVGSGHVIRGELYRGVGGSAGEIGHIVVDPAGPACMCGHRGCLVKFVGAEALRERAHERLLISRPSGAGDPGSVVAQVVARAQQGDPVAQGLLDEVGHYLGIALAGLVNLLNPAAVVLGGDITQAGELLIEPLRASIRFRALSTSIAATQILVSTLDDRSVAVGAATAVLAAALRDPAQFATAAERAARKKHIAS